MPRVIYITVRTPMGSGEEFFIDEMLELKSQGVDLLIIPRSPSSRNVTQSRATDLQNNCIYQPLVSPAILRDSIIVFLKYPILVMSILRLIINESGSAIHLAKNLAVLPKSLWLANLAKIRKVNHIYAQWASATSTMALITSKITGIPWSFTAHRGDIVANNLLAIKVKQASFVRFISHSGMQLAQSIVKQKLPKTCQTVHMGVRVNSGLVKNYHILRREITLMCPANLLPVKGHDYILRAMALLREKKVYVQLIIAGQGPLERSLRQVIVNLNIEELVIFAGHIEHSELLGYYANRNIDIVVLPSIEIGFGEHEGIPVSLMEAMSFGIPVISTMTAGIPELLSDGAGIMVPPRDSQTLADKIELLIRNPALRQQLGEAGRKKVLEEFNVEKTTTRIIELICG